MLFFVSDHRQRNKNKLINPIIPTTVSTSSKKGTSPFIKKLLFHYQKRIVFVDVPSPDWSLNLLVVSSLRSSAHKIDNQGKDNKDNGNARDYQNCRSESDRAVRRVIPVSNYNCFTCIRRELRLDDAVRLDIYCHAHFGVFEDIIILTECIKAIAPEVNLTWSGVSQVDVFQRIVTKVQGIQGCKIGEESIRNRSQTVCVETKCLEVCCIFKEVLRKRSETIILEVD